MIPLLISICAIILCVILYHKKITQLILRIGAIILLYFLTTNFSFYFKKSINLSPPVLLIDHSPSMKSHLKEILSRVDSLQFKYQKFFFSDSVYSDTSRSKPMFTNITNALKFGENLSSVCLILLSDGNHNYGPPPGDILDNFETPVYCFGAGIKNITDQLIADVIYPDYAFCNDTTAIEIIIETIGLGGKSGLVNLKSADIDITREIKLSENFSRQSVNFKIVPRKVGRHRFKISLKPQINETSYRNNEYNFTINVFERKIRILYYTDHPSFNTQFIINSLKKNIDVEYSEAIQISKDLFVRKGRFVSEREIEFNQFDIIIFDNVDADHLNIDFKGFLHKGGGMLITGGISGVNQNLNEILPFRVTGTQLQQELPIKILLPFSILLPKEEYPPVSRINHILGVNQNAILIARAGDFPLIGYRKVGSGFVFQINILELGVWHFAQLNLNRDILNPLIEDVLRFLSPYGRSERLLIKSAKNQYQTGEEIRFILKAYNQNLTPGFGGEFYLAYQNKKIPFFEITPGVYEAVLYAENPGEYTFSALGVLQNDTLKSNQLNIKIVERETETEELMNEELLQEIASRTGGEYYEISRLTEFVPPGNQKRDKVVNVSFDKPLFYFLIFVLVTIDWIIRKKGGMI